MNKTSLTHRLAPLLMRLLTVALLVIGLLLIALAAMPWELLRGQIESRISARLGVPVALAA